MSDDVSGDAGVDAENPADEWTVPPGKVFPDSINIYDDQAKLAFEYYKKAAQKIIAEEDRINGLRHECEVRIEACRKESGSSATVCIISLVAAAVLFLWLCFNVGFGVAVLVAAVPLCVAVANFLKKGKSDKKLSAERDVMAGLDRNFAEIRRDYGITKLGVAYVPVATSVPFEGRSFMLDDTQTAEPTEFSLYRMNAQDEFLATLDEIKNGKADMPVVESGESAEEIQTAQVSKSLDTVKMHDFIGSLDRSLRSASYYLNDLEKTSVSLPVVDPKGEYAGFIREYCAEEIGGRPVLDVFNRRTYMEDLKHFEELNEMRKRLAAENAKLEKTLQAFIVEVSEYVQLLSRAKLTSSSKIVDFSNSLLLNTFKSSYNHYSARLESEEIKRIQEDNFDYKLGEGDYKPFNLSPASRVLFDPISRNWVSEDGGRTSYPFGVHQIQEEIIAPLVQNLLKENRTERLKIYNNIMDQKRDYLNQWHRDTDDFYGRGRAESSEIITQMQTTLAEFNTAVSQYKAYDDAEKNMRSAADGDLEAAEIKASASGAAFSIAYCEEQTRQIRQQQDEFNDYITRLNDDIDRRASEFGYTKFFEASLRDGHAKEVAMALLDVAELDERQKILLGANSFIAANARLPPAPAVDDSVYGTLGTNLNDVASKIVSDLESTGCGLDAGSGGGDAGGDGDAAAGGPADDGQDAGLGGGEEQQRDE